MDEERRDPEETMEIIEGIDMEYDESEKDISEYVYEESREEKKGEKA